MTLEQAQQFFAGGKHSLRALPIDKVSMRALADALPQLVWSARPDGGVDFSNAAWPGFSNGSRDGDGAERWSRIVHPEDAPACLEAWHHAVRLGEPFEMEFRVRDHRSGEYRWHLGRALPGRTLTGRVERWFGTCTDIHRQKEALRALEVRAAELEASDRRRDEFPAILAHEIRNPLASIASAAALLRNADAEEEAWALDVIDRQTGQLTRLIDDLLDVVRIGTGKIQLRKVSLDLAAVLDRAVETTRPVIRANQHGLAIDYAHGSLLLEADADRVEQMVVNLLTNAAKYTPPRGHLILRAARVGEQVEVVVQDDGIGIAPEKLPEIFRLFTQGERPPSCAKDGLGIGLTVVQKLAELHGGTVSATSNGIGHGSQFTVRLPAGVSTESPLPFAAPVHLPASSASMNSRILIVDDHVDSAKGLARLLRRRGHVLEIADDGLAALRVAAAFRPHVVLLDLDLPTMDGCEVAVRFRRDASLRECLLIALTGYGREEDRKRSLEAGFDHHLLKPVDLEMLYGLLSDFRPACDAREIS